MKNFILAFTTGEKFIINQQEAELIASANNDQSITLKRIGVVAQKRMCLVYPESSPDKLEERKEQQYGILHDGTKARRHFGQWVADCGEVPDDKGNYTSVKLDTEYYPEVMLDCVASPEEFKQMGGKGANYYEFLGIKDKIKKIDGGGFKPLLENYDITEYPKKLDVGK